MENGVQALKIGTAMLIFVLALTITISCFTMASQALNRVFSAKEEQEYVKDAEGNYINFVNFDGGTREVGVETIIPAIYRAYKENYAIYFYDSSGNPLTLYTIKKNEGTINEVAININYIDLEKETHGSSEQAIESIKKLLYEECALDEDGLYEYLKGKTFIEKLGEYYMDDVSGETETAEVNKTKKRVIAYIQSI